MILKRGPTISPPNIDATAVVATLHRLADEVAALSALVRERVEPASSPYLTHEQAAAYLHLSPKTLSNHAREVTRTADPATGRPLYTRAELDRWVRNRRKGRRAGG